MNQPGAQGWEKERDSASTPSSASWDSLDNRKCQAKKERKRDKRNVKEVLPQQGKRQLKEGEKVPPQGPAWWMLIFILLR
jgi:hypothetical protein